MYTHRLVLTAHNYRSCTQRQPAALRQVQSTFLYTIRVQLQTHGSATSQAVSGRPLTAADKVRDRASPCGVC
jgi:hypothetical protein